MQKNTFYIYFKIILFKFIQVCIFVLVNLKINTVEMFVVNKIFSIQIILKNDIWKIKKYFEK